MTLVFDFGTDNTKKGIGKEIGMAMGVGVIFVLFLGSREDERHIKASVPN